MQGQMHVHVTEMDLPVPLVGQFFRRLRAVFTSPPERAASTPAPSLPVLFDSIPFP
jgi:hypothetical protein